MRAGWILPLLAGIALLALAGRAFGADEEENTKAPRAKPVSTVGFQIGAASFDGNTDRMRALARMPDDRWWAARWLAPVTRPGFDGILDGDIRSTGDGSMRLRGRPASGGLLEVRAARSLAPTFLYGPLPAEMSAAYPGSFGRTRDRLEARLRRPAEIFDGTMELSARWTRNQGRVGTIPQGLDLAQPLDPANRFAMPSWRTGDDQSFELGGRLSRKSDAGTFALDLGYRQDAMQQRITERDCLGGIWTGGGLSLETRDLRRTVEIGLTGDRSSGNVRVGGGYRFRLVDGQPRGSRDFGPAGATSGELRTQSGDYTATFHTLALGAAAAPLRGLRVGARIDGMVGQLDGRVDESRSLATFQYGSGKVSSAPWRVGASTDASFSPRGRFSFDLDASAASARESQDWSASTLLADHATVVLQRGQNLDRIHEDARAELRANARLGARSKLLLGYRVQDDAWRWSSVQAIEFARPGNEDRARGTAFTGLRLHPIPAVSADLALSWFDERARFDYGGTGAVKRDGMDLRAHVAGVTKLGTLFVQGAWTDDRYDVGALPAASDVTGMAPVDFRARSLLASGGASASAGKTLFTISGTRVSQGADLRAVIQEITGEVATPVGAQRLSAGVRWLEVNDSRESWQDGHGLLGFVQLGGRF
jgi:hypothetical protein